MLYNQSSEHVLTEICVTLEWWRAYPYPCCCYNMDMSAPIFNSYRWDGISVWSFESLVKSFSLGGVGEIIRHFFPPGYRYPYSISCFTISLTNHVHFFECINKSNYLKPEEQANTISMTWCKVHFKIKWILRKPHPFPNPPFKESK